MPYVDKVARKRMDPAINDLVSRIESLGDLNYAITRLAVLKLSTPPSYAALSAIHGVLTDAADEWYRRVMGPYEDAKMEENGNVYVG